MDHETCSKNSGEMTKKMADMKGRFGKMKDKAKDLEDKGKKSLPPWLAKKGK